MTTAEQLSERKEREHSARVTLEADIRVLMSLPQGKRVMFHVLDELCGIVKGSFVAGVADAARISDRNEGRRSVGLDLLSLLQTVEPTIGIDMLLEKLTAQRNEQTLRRADAVPNAPHSSST